MAKKIDWDERHRRDRLLRNGGIPHWQDGWTSDVEFSDGNDPNQPVLIGRISFQGGIIVPEYSKMVGRECRWHCQEIYTIGLSRVIRDWILAPYRSKLPGSPGDPEYQEACKKTHEEFDRRMQEKAYFDDLQLSEGVIKVFWKCKKLADLEFELQLDEDE